MKNKTKSLVYGSLVAAAEITEVITRRTNGVFFYFYYIKIVKIIKIHFFNKKKYSSLRRKKTEPKIS